MILSVAAYTPIERKQEELHNIDFSKSYITSKDYGAVTLRYNPGGWFSDARASTDLSVANDQTGIATVVIQGMGSTEKISSSHTIVSNGIINSGIAKTSGIDYAVYCWHSATRYQKDNSLIREWNYKLHAE